MSVDVDRLERRLLVVHGVLLWLAAAILWEERRNWLTSNALGGLWPAGIVGILVVVVGAGSTRGRLGASIATFLASIFLAAAMFPWTGHASLASVVLAGFAVVVPVAALAIRGASGASTFLALVGGVFVVATLFTIREIPGPVPWGADVASAALALFAVGTVAAAAPPTAGRRPRSGAPFGFRTSWTTALVLLPVSWLFGGDGLIAPIWSGVLALVAAPAVLRAPARWLPGFVVVALLAIGFVPVHACTTRSWTDAMFEDSEPFYDSPRRASTAELAARGPNWSEGGGFSGSSTTCPPSALAIGGMWLAALIAASAWEPRARDAVTGRKRSNDDRSS